jgi:cobalt transport protein ATP-binding subunit
VVHDVSLAIGAGEMIALIGRNGSGKTTLAKHLNGLLRATSGTVRLDGADVATMSLDRVAPQVGYVFQNPDDQLFAATVADEVAFGPRNFGLDGAALAARVAEVLAAVGLTERRDDDPFLLSKGERQRLAVATVLAMAPRVLMLDEPTTGLDYPQQRRMLDLLARLRAGGTTVIVITHTPWVVAEYAERALLMRAGELVFDGPLDRLFGEEDLLRSAAFEVPPATRVGRALGLAVRSVDELARALVVGR